MVCGPDMTKEQPSARHAYRPVTATKDKNIIYFIFSPLNSNDKVKTSDDLS